MSWTDLIDYKKWKGNLAEAGADLRKLRDWLARWRARRDDAIKAELRVEIERMKAELRDEIGQLRAALQTQHAAEIEKLRAQIAELLELHDRRLDEIENKVGIPVEQATLEVARRDPGSGKTEWYERPPRNKALIEALKAPAPPQGAPNKELIAALMGDTKMLPEPPRLGELVEPLKN